MLGQRLAIMLVPTIVLLDNSEECHEHVQKLAFKTGTFSHGNTQALAAPWLLYWCRVRGHSTVAVVLVPSAAAVQCLRRPCNGCGMHQCTSGTSVPRSLSQ